MLPVSRLQSCKSNNLFKKAGIFLCLNRLFINDSGRTLQEFFPIKLYHKIPVSDLGFGKRLIQVSNNILSIFNPYR